MARVRPPKLPATLPWLNTPTPISLVDLKGRVVLLDFWTYGCINCINLIPTLKAIEQTYGDALKIIGIHAGKFSAEQSLGNIRHAIAKHTITHPVVVDSDFQLWQAYAIKAWPTLVFIEPDGYIVRQVVGERDLNFLSAIIDPLLPQVPSLAPLPTNPTTPPSHLRYPTGIFATEKQLFIADTGHHRIAVTTLDGTFQTTVGQGTPGLIDGDFATAQFNQPHGLTWDNATQHLYIADTGNHCIRLADFSTQTVTTLAGNGEQNRCIFPHCGLTAHTPLNAPWDIAKIDQVLYIAMAGAHQIWTLDLATGQLATYAGTGAEGCVDGDRTVAAFAQPSSLATDGTWLYAADSETSCIRRVQLCEHPTVETLCGSGALFEFGDRDGIGEAVRLQHPLGIALGTANELWIADTYNHKLKRLNLVTHDCQTVARLNPFSEPTGLSFAGGLLFVADTNHHRIQSHPTRPPRLR
ncbi:MAG: thioredoxin-like domain-containing protein [Cyanobacteria bacterium P01_F01_bin.4]